MYVLYKRDDNRLRLNVVSLNSRYRHFVAYECDVLRGPVWHATWTHVTCYMDPCDMLRGPTVWRAMCDVLRGPVWHATWTHSVTCYVDPQCDMLCVTCYLDPCDMLRRPVWHAMWTRVTCYMDPCDMLRGPTVWRAMCDVLWDPDLFVIVNTKV